ncbi:hypothetical protein Tco_0305613, partial [Tanacetum coccineum]
IAGEELSDPESPTPKPTKPTKQAKPKATEQPTVSKSKAKTSKPAPAKPKEKKRKPVSEPSETQPLPKRAKAGKVTKKRTIKSSKKLIDLPNSKAKSGLGMMLSCRTWENMKLVNENGQTQEEAVAREVHATHARIVSGPDPEPMQEV